MFTVSDPRGDLCITSLPNHKLNLEELKMVHVSTRDLGNCITFEDKGEGKVAVKGTDSCLTPWKFGVSTMPCSSAAPLAKDKVVPFTHASTELLASTSYPWVLKAVM